jgi:hypothetical protein
LLSGQGRQPASTASGTLSNGVRYEFRQYFEPDLPAVNRWDLGAGVGTTKDLRVRRFFWDASERTYYGYEVAIELEPASQSFRVQFAPLPQDVSESFPEVVRRGGPLRQIEPLPLPDPVTAASGDTLRWKVLVNGKTGHAIVDTLRLYGPLGRTSQAVAGPARGVTLQDVELRWIGATVIRNGQELYKFAPGSGIAGSYTWVELPGAGRVVFSVAPVAGYDFRLAGTIEGDAARFQLGTDEYQLQCEQSIFRQGGRWRLYVWHDAAFPSRAFALGGADRLGGHSGRQNE